jgi:hypothetical protein
MDVDFVGDGNVDLAAYPFTQDTPTNTRSFSTPSKTQRASTSERTRP